MLPSTWTLTIHSISQNPIFTGKEHLAYLTGSPSSTLPKNISYSFTTIIKSSASQRAVLWRNEQRAGCFRRDTEYDRVDGMGGAVRHFRDESLVARVLGARNRCLKAHWKRLKQREKTKTKKTKILEPRWTLPTSEPLWGPTQYIVWKNTVKPDPLSPTYAKITVCPLPLSQLNWYRAKPNLDTVRK